MNVRTSTRFDSRGTSETVHAALRFARRVHLGQYRKQTYEQFIEHPIAVARLLADAGADDRLLVAAYLHDVVEKTRVEPEEIAERFGPDTGEIVVALTDDEEIDGYAERKRALRAQVLSSSRGAVLIYAADRLANMDDWLSLDPEERPACAERLETSLDERIELWREDLDELTAYDPELPFLAEVELALRELSAETA